MTDEERRDKVRERLHVVFKALQDVDDASGAAASEFAFHMLDAEDDIDAFAHFLAQPDAYDDAAVRRIVQGVLLHAVGHLVAAARLAGGLIDTFASTKQDVDS